MTGLQRVGTWEGPSTDPNDEQFGDVVERASLDEADDYDAIFVGEPTDRAVIGRQGAASGPGALRKALAGVKTHHFDAGPVGSRAADGPVGSLADLGNVDIPPVAPAAIQEAVRETTATIHERDALPVFLGGDNSLSYPNVAPLLESNRVGAINFDAHLDCRTLQDGPTSGTPYRQLIEEGLDALAVVGARHFETSTAYHDYLRENGGEVVTAEEVTDDPVTAADRALDSLGDVDAVYVSVDLDVLDATAAPGVSAPTPGGISTLELYRALRLVASDDRIAGFEVVECAPPLDENERTVAAGSRAIAHFLAGYGVVGGSRSGSVEDPGRGSDD